MNFLKPKKAFFIFSIITIIFSYAILKLNYSNTTESKYNIYSIKFNYYGIDPLVMERLITKPLEEKLIELDSICELKSTCRFNESITTAWFYKTADTDSTYLKIRTITENLYNTLPNSVQKPQIINSNTEEKAVICISLNADKDYIEKYIKSKIESINGVTEVIISGTENKNISINFNNMLIANYHITPDQIAKTISIENSSNISAEKKSSSSKSSYFFNNRLNCEHELPQIKLLTEKSSINLNHIARITQSVQPKTETVLLNNIETSFINIKTSDSSNLINISTECHKLFQSKEIEKLRPIFIYDIGQKQKEIFLSVIRTLMITIIITGVIVFIFYHSLKFSLILSAVTITTIIWTLGFLSISGISINENLLSGISISIGLIADTSLVLYEIQNQTSSTINFHKKAIQTIPSILISTITTLIAIIPLLFISTIIPSVKNTGLSILFMLIISTIISLCFLPSFLPSFCIQVEFINNQVSLFKTKFKQKTRQMFLKFLKIQKYIKSIFYLSALCTLLLFIILPKNIQPVKESDIFYFSIEFNPERKIDSVKNELSEYIKSVEQIPNVNFVKTDITRGNAEFEVIYSNTTENKIADLIREKSSLIKKAYIYIPKVTKKIKPVSIQIAVSGDDESKCRDIAKETASLINQNNLALQTTLNFKDEEIMYNYVPDKNKLSLINLYTADSAQQLRQNIFNPVVTKIIINNQETDVTLSSELNKDFDSLNKINIITDNSSIPLKDSGTITKSKIPSKIYRLNSRACAYFSIELDKKDFTKKYNSILNTLSQIKLNDGYKFVIPSLIIENQNAYKKLTAIIIFCIFCIYCFLVTKNENFKLSFIILLCIPSSLFLPLLLRFLTGSQINFGDTVGIILLSGIVINNSIYISEAPGKTVYGKISKRIKSILITSLTTIFSSLPMVFLSNSEFIKSLSFFMTTGVLNSIIVSLFLFSFFLKDFFTMY